MYRRQEYSNSEALNPVQVAFCDSGKIRLFTKHTTGLFALEAVDICIGMKRVAIHITLCVYPSLQVMVILHLFKIVAFECMCSQCMP